MTNQDDLMADKTDDDVTDIEGETEYDKNVIDEEKFINPNDGDDDEAEAETIETELDVNSLAKHGFGEAEEEPDEE
jgi:hypothetical protein